MTTGVEEVAWTRGEEQFAFRLPPKQLEGVFQKSVRVPEGSAAILFVEEKYDTTLGPGVHRLGATIFGLGKKKGVVMVNSGEVPLVFSMKGLLTNDPLHANFDCQLRVKLQPGREVMFITSLMRERDAVTLDDLRSLLYGEVKETGSILMAKHTVRELAENLQLKQEFALEIEDHLKRTFDTSGLAFATVQTANFSCEVWDKATGTRMEAALQATDQEARLEGRKKLFQIATEAALQGLIEETQKVAMHEKRIQVFERMWRAASSEKMTQVRTARELEDFLRDVDRDKLMKESDFEDFKKNLAATMEDKDRMRAHMAAIAVMKREQEQKVLELSQRSDLSRQQLEAELGLQRLDMETRLQTELRRVDLELERERHQREFARSQTDAEAAALRERELAEARKQAEVSGVGREVQRLDAEMGLALEEKKRAVDRQHQAEMNRIGWEQRERELDLELRKQEADQRARMDALRQQHEQEMQKLGAVGGLSIHALIAVSEPDKAPLLTDLAKTEALKGMTPEQILAMAAANAPELGPALAEMAGKAGTDKERAMYERLITEQKEAGGRTREDYQRFMDTMKGMFDKALDTQRDVASSFARGPAAQPPVVVMPGGVVTPGQPAQPQEVVVCRACLQKSPTGTKYCPNCGGSLMQKG